MTWPGIKPSSPGPLANTKGAFKYIKAAKNILEYIYTEKKQPFLKKTYRHVKIKRNVAVRLYQKASKKQN